MKLEEQRNTGHRVRRTSTATQGNSDRARMPYHEVLGFLNPLLVAVLQVNNQGTNSFADFRIHPRLARPFNFHSMGICVVDCCLPQLNYKALLLALPDDQENLVQAVGIWNRFKGSDLTEQPRQPRSSV
ncbi:hypothetical protein EZV62_009571 [Acer yangbiense]|uniref:Uncharacterized protein n=1 Tax=Acer yangbiense TaxID=1000413 RepID=A0A5C7HZL0_9ROSI|nr:hypothetical protein EZV62_009571 [Acer yangbiense]